MILLNLDINGRCFVTFFLLLLLAIKNFCLLKSFRAVLEENGAINLEVLHILVDIVHIFEALVLVGKLT